MGVYSLFQALIAGPMMHLDTASWGFREQTEAVVLITITQALFNHFGIRLTTALTDFSGTLILLVSVVLTLAFLVGGRASTCPV